MSNQTPTTNIPKLRCKVCGKEFEPQVYKQQYCSDECYVEDTKAMMDAFAALGKAMTERMKK